VNSLVEEGLVSAVANGVHRALKEPNRWGTSPFTSLTLLERREDPITLCNWAGIGQATHGDKSGNLRSRKAR
jgi:hypothetical protein